MGVGYTSNKYSHIFTAQRKIRNKVHKKTFACALYHPQRLIDETKQKAIEYDEELLAQQEDYGGRSFNLYVLNKKSKFPLLNGLVYRPKYDPTDHTFSECLVLQIPSLKTKKSFRKQIGIRVQSFERAWEIVINAYRFHRKLDGMTMSRLHLDQGSIKDRIEKYRAQYLESLGNPEILPFDFNILKSNAN